MHGAWKILSSLTLAFALLGCSKAEEVTLSADPSAPSDASVTSSGPWTITTSVAEDGQLVAEVVPAAGYKVNLEYPWRLTVADATTRIDDADVFTEQRARFSAQPGAEGERSGELRFSICNASTCLTPRETLNW